MLHDFENKWRADISELPMTVRDEKDKIITLDDAENVEVGFQRV